MKKNNLIFGLFALLLIFTSCNDDEELSEKNDVSSTEFAEIKPLLGVFTEKRLATDKEIADLKTKKQLTARGGCSLHSDAECSESSTPEFLRYVNNCVTYPIPSFGGFYTSTTLAAISYYVDGDGDVNCDHYEDDLQNMINNIISSTGPVWSIQAKVHSVSSCNERSSQNFIAFELTIFTPQP